MAQRASDVFPGPVHYANSARSVYTHSISPFDCQSIALPFLSARCTYGSCKHASKFPARPVHTTSRGEQPRIGFLEGLWRFRQLTPEPISEVIADTAPQKRDRVGTVMLTLKPLDGVPRSGRRNPRHAAAPAMGREPPTYAALLVLIALLVPLHRWWSVQILLVPMLLIIPGAVLLRGLRIPGRVVGSFPVYVPCASIVVLFGSGLVVDLLGPLIGVSEPLRAAPFLISLEVTCFAMLAASVNAPSDVALQWRSLLQPARLAWPFVLPAPGRSWCAPAQ